MPLFSFGNYNVLTLKQTPIPFQCMKMVLEDFIWKTATVVWFLGWKNVSDHLEPTEMQEDGYMHAGH